MKNIKINKNRKELYKEAKEISIRSCALDIQKLMFDEMGNQKSWTRDELIKILKEYFGE